MENLLINVWRNVRDTVIWDLNMMKLETHRAEIHEKGELRKKRGEGGSGWRRQMCRGGKMS